MRRNIPKDPPKRTDDEPVSRISTRDRPAEKERIDGQEPEDLHAKLHIPENRQRQARSEEEERRCRFGRVPPMVEAGRSC